MSEPQIVRWPIAKGSSATHSKYPLRRSGAGGRVDEYYYRLEIPLYLHQKVRESGEDPDTFECATCRNAGLIRRPIAPGSEYCHCAVGQAFRWYDGQGDPDYQGPAVPVRPGTALLMRYWKWELDDFVKLHPKYQEGKALSFLAARSMVKRRGLVIEELCQELQMDLPRLYASFPRMATEFRSSLILFGTPGTGKTTLMAMIAKAWHQVGVPFVVHEWRQMVGEIQSTYRNDGGERDRFHIIKEATTAPMLFLDDLGDVTKPGRPESDDRREILREIITGRYNTEKPFVITTNLPPAYLQAAFGEMVYQRLIEMAVCVEAGGAPLPSREK